MSFDKERLVEVSWDTNVKTSRPIKLEILCYDKIGMLASLTQCISNSGANILNVSAKQSQSGNFTCNFEVNIKNAAQLRELRRKLEQVKGVIRVERAKRA